MTILRPFNEGHLAKQVRLDPVDGAELRAGDSFCARRLCFQCGHFFEKQSRVSHSKAGADLAGVGDFTISTITKIKRADRAIARPRGAKA